MEEKGLKGFDVGQKVGLIFHVQLNDLSLQKKKKK